MLLWLYMSAALMPVLRQRLTGGRVNLAESVVTGLRVMISLLPAMVVYVIATYLGLLLLIVTGLYVMAMWWLVVPVAVFEGRWFGALGRSFDLTRGYRWPMVGLVAIFLLLYLVVMVVGMALQSAVAPLGVGGLAAAALLSLLLTVFGAALGAAVFVLAYMRLRELKGEAAFGSVADVFS